MGLKFEDKERKKKETKRKERKGNERKRKERKLVKCYIWSTAIHGAEIFDTSESKSEIY
jgi:hypothetical protein